MAPLPANGTNRLWVDYTTGRVAHTFSLRYPQLSTLGDALAAGQAFLATLQTALPNDWAVTGARWQAAGSDITMPTALGVLTGFVGTGGVMQDAEDEPREYVWVGRTALTGRRWELSLYGLKIQTPATYRYQTSNMPPSLQAAIDVLGTMAQAGEIIGIDGVGPLVYPYVNVNYNSYWESRSRRS